MLSTSNAPPCSAEERCCLGFLWLALVCALAPFGYAFGFCFPRGDDFDEVTRAMFLFDLPGGIYEVGREWLTWSGRYTYHFLAVFLGKAAELRWVCGLACGTVLALHGLVLYGLIREAAVPRRHALPLACLALLALCTSYRHLWAFYMLTDALTMGLQSAAGLGFFWSLCALWNHCDATDVASVRRGQRTAALLGVLAVGVYEHAALAVMCSAGCACMLAVFHDRRRGLSFGAGRFRIFLRVALWCLGGLLVSFLAPGNSVRRQVRGIDADTVRQQLAAVPGDWLHALGGFVHSRWPLTMAGIVLLLVLLRRREHPRLSRGEALLLAVLVLAMFCLYSLGLTTLHALSDVPLLCAAKLPASLDLYAAFALGFAIFVVLAALPDFRGRGHAFLIGGALLALCCTGDNFQQTLRNTVNGDMVLYGDFMTARDAWLRHVGGLSTRHGRFRFGLVGEILYPGSRSRKLLPDAVVTQVAAWPRTIFPVIAHEGLPMHAAHWPNQWAAWMYGVDAVASAPPDPVAALTVVDDAPATTSPSDLLQLRLTPEARSLGLTGAWRVNACGGPNPTFALTWLVLHAERPLPETLDLLVPSPLSGRRLVPLPAQAWLLRRLEQEVNPLPDIPDRWAATELHFSSAAQLVKKVMEPHFRYAFPLGPAAPLTTGTSGSVPAPDSWPASLFLRLDGDAFLRLMPASAPS